MVRIVLGVVVGFVAWVIVWVGSEKILSAIWPEFGTHQLAFEAAIKNGGPFTADTTMLLTHIVLGSIVSVMAGFLAALIAGENKRAPLVLGILLLALGLLKAAMSWPYVPIWYHVIFTALPMPMTIIGGKLRRAGSHLPTKSGERDLVDFKAEQSASD
jgi:hypothetical protein